MQFRKDVFFKMLFPMNIWLKFQIVYTGTLIRVLLQSPPSDTVCSGSAWFADAVLKE